MRKQDIEHLKERFAVLLATGVTEELFAVADIGVLLAEIDSLRADLRVLAKKDNYTTSSDGFEDIWLMIDGEPDPADFAAEALKRSDGEVE